MGRTCDNCNCELEHSEILKKSLDRIEEELINLKNLVVNYPKQKIIEIDIEWPEADINGLHFNAQKTHSVFDLKNGGDYYSRDIFIVSAGDTYDGPWRDLISEYLDNVAVMEALKKTLKVAIPNARNIRFFIPIGLPRDIRLPLITLIVCIGDIGIKII